MASVTLHGFAPSTFTRTARMACLEKGVAHQLVPLDFGEPNHFALHPFGKMPILTDGDVTVFETAAIIGYLDSAFPDTLLIPTDPMARVQTLTALSVAIDYAYRPVVFAAKPQGRAAPAKWAKTAQVFDWLDACLQRQNFVAGPDCGAADLMFAPMLAYHITEHGDEHVVEKRAALARWYHAMTARRSFIDSAS